MILCPRCGSDDTSVIDSRGEGGPYIRRRRGCKACGQRMTTVEMLAQQMGKVHSAGRTAKASLAAAVMVSELVEMRERITTLLTLVESGQSMPERPLLVEAESQPQPEAP